ncbi:MAG: nuclear transport factor 2 family protein [Alphaproteobacteria bacterium]|nr:nuclear transport factor 2 family protein [Alphaproteobacteria bacterium]
MPDTDEVALWYALYRLTANYWYEVDFNGGGKAHEFYLPDALFAVGESQFRGHDKIRAFYTRRQQRGRTMTRHLFNNLQVLPVDAGRVRVIGVLSLYRADGRPPFQGERPPMLVADIAAECVLGDDRQWRYRSHALHPIFVGSDIPYSLSIDPQVL